MTKIIERKPTQLSHLNKKIFADDVYVNDVSKNTLFTHQTLPLNPDFC